MRPEFKEARPCGQARSSLFPEKSSRGSRRQKRPFDRQHRLNFLALPHGQRSFRPSFSSSSFSPCTICSPALTRLSDGKPLRRLLIASRAKAVRFVVVVEKSVRWTRDTSGENENRVIGLRTARKWRKGSRSYPLRLLCSFQLRPLIMPRSHTRPNSWDFVARRGGGTIGCGGIRLCSARVRLRS